MTSGRTRRSVWRLGVGGVLVVAGLFALASGVGSPQPVLVLVTIAGMRSESVQPELTPALSEIEARGRRIESVSTPIPLVVPALSSLLTGRSPVELGTIHDDLSRVPHDVPTALETLAAREFNVAAFGGDGRVSILTGLYRGSDEVRIPSSPFLHPLLPDETNLFRPSRSGTRPAETVVDAAVQHARAIQRGDRAFFWVHLSDPAVALDKPGASESDYVEAVRRVDEAVGALRAAFRTSGLSRNFSMIVASVHGMSLGDEGEFRHGMTLSPGAVEVPVILEGEIALRSDDVVTLADLHGLLLEAADVTPREEPPARAGNPVRLAPIASRAYGLPTPRQEWRDGAWHDVEEIAETSGLEAIRETLDRMRRASRLASEGDVDAAFELLEEAAEASPGAPAPLSMMISLATEASRAEDPRWKARARSALERLTEIDAGESVPRRIDTARMRARIDPRDALDAAFALAEQPLSPGQRVAVAELMADLGSADRGVALLEPLVKGGDAAQTADLREWMGDQLRERGNAFQARSLYEKALENPAGEKMFLLAKLGLVARELGDLEAALSYLARALRASGAYRFPHAAAGDVLMQMERFGAAAHAYVQSVPVTGNDRIDSLRRAQILESKGLAALAVRELEALRGRFPNDLGLRIALARALASAGKQGQATAMLNGVLREQPGNPAVLYELARTKALQGRPDEALAYLERAEPRASSDVVMMVRSDPTFLQWGNRTQLAVRAQTFGKGGGGPDAPGARDEAW